MHDAGEAETHTGTHIQDTHTHTNVHGRTAENDDVVVKVL